MSDTHNGARSLHEGFAVTRLHSADGATALVADHGAHVLSWIPAGDEEALFLSAASQYDEGAAIRGGVPIIFPQFAERGTGCRHGFARIVPWQLLDVGLTADGVATGRWHLQDAFDAADSGGLHGRYRLTFDVRLAAKTIEFGLTIANPGATVWQCNAALHTYLRVSDLAISAVEGLQETPVVFDTEVDRIYSQAPSSVRLLSVDQSIAVQQTGFNDTVIWNPGAGKAAALRDLQKEEYRHFVCIEAATIIQPIVLGPGTEWRGTQLLKIIKN
ncbi:MAG: D-hexose-6-phosphate mutarotase [Pseudomonadota bacterium]